MSVYEKTFLRHMDIDVEGLGRKHQLNPNNNGVTRIDNVIAYSKDSGEFISDIVGIYFESDKTPYYRLELVRGNNAIAINLSGKTKVLTPSGSYCSIDSNTLHERDKLYIVDNNDLQEWSIHSIKRVSLEYTYNIKTSRHNYVTSTGLIVESD